MNDRDVVLAETSVSGISLMADGGITARTVGISAASERNDRYTRQLAERALEEQLRLMWYSKRLDSRCKRGGPLYTAVTLLILI